MVANSASVSDATDYPQGRNAAWGPARAWRFQTARGRDAVINFDRYRHRAAQMAHFHWRVAVGGGPITQLPMPIVAAGVDRD